MAAKLVRDGGKVRVTYAIGYDLIKRAASDGVQEYMKAHVDLDSDMFVARPYGMLEVKRGLDDRLRAAFQEDRGDRVCDSGYFSCIAMRDGFFESCPDSLFQIEIGSGAELVEKFLTQFSPIVRQRDMDVFHNEVEITVDRRFVPHEQVVEIVKQACAKEGMPLHINHN